MMTQPEAVSRPEPQPLDVSFFSNHAKKSIKLVNNKDPEFSVDGRHVWYNFEFSAPVYVENITVLTVGYGGLYSLELVAELVSGRSTSSSQKINESGNTFSVNRVVSGFRFKPERKWGKTRIARIEVTGLSFEELASYENVVKDRVSIESQLSSQRDEVNQLAARHSDLTTQVSELDTNVGKARGELSALENSIDNSRNSFDSVSSDLKDVQARLKTTRDERRETSERLDTLKKELKMFPSEIAGFVREGNRNFRWYVGLSIPFIAILSVVLYKLFSNAVDLTQLWKKGEDVDIWTVFLTRIPFVVVTLALIETCSYAIGRFIFEIMRINRQRLELAKLSIVARDVSNASAHHTGLSDDEVFERETKLKMEMLREYMRGYSGSEFEYRGSALISTIVNVASKVAGSNRGD